jgi:hypothetical protein
MAQIRIGSDDHPVVGIAPFDEPDDERNVVAVTTAADDVVVVVAAGRTVVVVAVDLTVVVVAPPAAVVVVAAMLVVVAGEAATTVHVMPDGVSVGVTANVSCTFQYLSSCVADALPSVHAKPRLYVPAGTTVGPSAPNKLNESGGSPVINPPGLATVATPVVPFVYGVPEALNKGCRYADPVPAGNGPFAS